MAGRGEVRPGLPRHQSPAGRRSDVAREGHRSPALSGSPVSLRRLSLSLIAVAAIAPAGAARAEEGFLAAWLRRHPETAGRLGDHRADTSLPDVSPAGLSRAPGPPPASLAGPGTRADAALLANAFAIESSAGARAAPFESPDWYTRRLRVALEAPARGLYASSCSRAARLVARLRAVPEYLRQATLNLGGRSGGAAPPRGAGPDLALLDLD